MARPMSLFRARSGLAVAALASCAALVLAGALPAQAAAGDQAHATGQYLGGTLLGSDLTAWVGLGGSLADSSGATSETNSNNLDLTTLGNHTVSVPGGLQIPISGASAGVVGQYASASASATSVGASGLVGAGGAIGTGVTPLPNVAPGPLSVDLATVVNSVGLSSELLTQIGNLALTVGVTSASASQSAPTAATGAYEIAGANLTFVSPAIASLMGDLTDTIASAQTAVNALAGPAGTISTALNSLPLTGLLSSTTALTGSTLALTLPTTLTSVSAPGVSVNLATGTVSVDLSAFSALNNQLPGTSIFSAVDALALSTSVTNLITDYTTAAEAALLAQVGAIGITSQTTILTIPVLSINSTIADLLTGSTGISLLNGTVVVGGAAGIATLLGTALASPVTALTGLAATLIAPIVALVTPAITDVLAAVLSITVNNQLLSAGVFTETALRVTVLPSTSALTLDVANASVGANSIAVVVPPVVVPPVVVPPVVVPPVVVPPVITDPLVSAGGSNASNDSLATTGTNALPPLLIGALFLLAGITLMVVLGARRLARRNRLL